MTSDNEQKKIQINIQIPIELNETFNSDLDELGLQKTEVISVLIELWHHLPDLTKYNLINKKNRENTIKTMTQSQDQAWNTALYNVINTIQKNSIILCDFKLPPE